MALELSGLPPNPFHFHGFPPRDKGPLKSYLLQLGGVKGTHILFESPSRIIKTATILSEMFPESPMAICRELTKVYQTIHRFYGKDFVQLAPEVVTKGEFVLLFYVPKGGRVSDEKIEKLALDYLQGNRGNKQLSKILGQALGKTSKEIYDILIKKG